MVRVALKPKALCGVLCSGGKFSLVRKLQFQVISRPRHHRHARVCTKAASDGKDEENQQPSEGYQIDDLARRLSFEAAKMRQSFEDSANMSEDDYGQEFRDDGFAKQLNSAGRLSEEAEVRVLADTGEGGFFPEDFELFRPLGQIQVKQRVELERTSPLASTSYEEGPEQTAVLAFTARYYSGMPFQDPVTVLVKEYLPACRSAAYKELQVMRQLLGGLPEDKWWSASRPVSEGAPVVRLLGFYRDEPSMTAAQRAAEEGQTGFTENLRMVYKWESLRPLAVLPGSARQPERQEGLLGRILRAASAGPLAAGARQRFLKSLMRGCIEAVEFCHARGVAHGSLGPGCFMLSTIDDGDADELRVKLDNFGYAVCSPPGGIGEGGQVEGGPEDAFATGLTLLEAVFKTLGDADGLARGAVERLVRDVFPGDMDGLRAYCEGEGGLGDAVAFLDDGGSRAGWGILGALLAGRPLREVTGTEEWRAFFGGVASDADGE
mmetsp:Transcript_6224/g.14948  ORF Transcript_6224/g.14948 Transcript_6224/m.14948 type:complete len:493 (-) Transcript_6224:234-1712(-)